MDGRRIEPEILDSLPSGDRRAVKSRRDLRLLNGIMGHVGILDEQLGLVRGELQPRRILDLGTGDGWLLYRLLDLISGPNLKPDTPRGEVVLLDRNPAISAGIAGALDTMGWDVQVVAGDVLEWLEQADTEEPFDLCLGNLFLHHFRDSGISRLFEALQSRARVVAACEPRRSTGALMASYGVGLIGCNSVTRHDAVVSVRAGFAADELTRLWPQHRDWMTHERPVGLFSHYFCARRLDQ